MDDLVIGGGVGECGCGHCMQCRNAEPYLVEERCWLIYFEDPDIPSELFTDEASAISAYKRYLDSWACHLFKIVPKSDIPDH
jgi:hypothetical protein